MAAAEGVQECSKRLEEDVACIHVGLKPCLHVHFVCFEQLHAGLLSVFGPRTNLGTFLVVPPTHAMPASHVGRVREPGTAGAIYRRLMLVLVPISLLLLISAGSWYIVLVLVLVPISLLM